jgi:26S proteasome regulatory subunit N5
MELLRLLIKKRGQPVKAQVEMVRQAMTYIDHIDNNEKKMEYVRCLREVCEKKIYLEVR